MGEKSILIERYLSGELSPEEKLEFFKLLEVDDAFKKEFELHSNIKDALSEVHIMDLRSSINDLYTKDNKRTKYRQLVYYISAACILLISLVGITIYQTLEKTNIEVYEDHYSVYTSVNIRGSSVENKLLNSAFQYYENAEYSKSRNEFFGILKINPDNSVAQFYVGILSLHLLEPNNSIKYLRKLSEDKTQLFYDVSNWYLALAYLYAGDVEKCENVVDKIISEKLCYLIQAKKLKKDLKRIRE